MVGLPLTLGVYVTEHVLESAVALVNVHVAGGVNEPVPGVNAPLPVDVNVTVPLGADCVPPSLSVTDAVQTVC